MGLLEHKPRLLYAVALGIAGTMLLASCSASTGDEIAGRDDSTELVEKNQAQWAMPLDEFVVASTELGNYAEQLLLGKCLTDEGYQWEVPWQNTDFKPPANFNSIGIKLFTVETAQEWGYRLAPPADQESARRWIEFTQFADSYIPDGSFEEKFMSCLQDVRDPDTMRDSEQLDYVMNLKIQATDVARADPAARRAVGEWKQCLEDQFSFEVPNIPQEMPTASLQERFSSSGSTLSSASADEISIAIADATCQESSGYQSARYAAEWDAEVELLEKNRDKLERIRTEAVTHREELLTVIAANAPAA